MSEYIQLRTAEIATHILPRSFAYRISDWIADSYWRRDFRGRTAVMANLRQVFAFQQRPAGQAVLADHARRTFRYFGRYLVDYFYFSRITAGQVEKLVVKENANLLDEARALKRGILLVSAHLGNWELGGAVIAAMGYTVNGIVLPQKDQRLDEFFAERRRRRDIKQLRLGRAVRDILAALARNELVALLADRDYTGHNDMAVFFGAEAPLPRGPSWLASHVGAPIVPGFLLRDDDGRFRLRFGRMLVPERGMPQAVIQRHICAALEEEIGRNPCQWYMFQEIWDGKGYGLRPPRLL